MIDQWMSQWIAAFSFKQAIVAFVVAILLTGVLVSLIVLLARFSVWQAALAGLATISAIFLYYTVRIVFLVAKALRS